MMSIPHIALLMTLDTKLEEARFVADQIRRFGGEPLVFNLGAGHVDDPLVDVSQEEILAAGLPVDPETVERDGEKLTWMRSTVSGARAILDSQINAGEVDAVMAVAGGQGSWLSSEIVRTLPVGFPKYLVSTAGRDVGQYTRFSDITNVFSITDVAGTNPFLSRVLTTAAAAVCGMARSKAWTKPLPDNLVAVSVYGITTAGATVAMDGVSQGGYEPVAFHANGVGGPTMEDLIAAGSFRAVLDYSITELADEVVGGICTAGPGRLTNAVRLGLPQVIVPGGIDVVNFAALDTMPDRFTGRLTHAHTPEATLLRTNPEENRRIAELVASRIDATTAPIHVVVPLGGFSTLSAPGGPLEDREANKVFFDTLREVSTNPLITVSGDERCIVDPSFATDTANDFVALVNDHSA